MPKHKSKPKPSKRPGTPDRPTWVPYYERVTRNKKKYTRKQKHKTDYRNQV